MTNTPRPPSTFLRDLFANTIVLLVVTGVLALLWSMVALVLIVLYLFVTGAL